MANGASARSLHELHSTSPYSVLLLAVTLRRFYITWDYRRRVTYILHAAFIISSAVSVGFLIPSIRDLCGNIEPENELYHACLITQKPVMWVAFGLFVVGFTLYNVGECPRTVDVKLIKRLQHDGAVYFVALFGMPFLVLACKFEW
ncbi:hypothetical protein OF83DRAFT_1178454 [Amylostereum chailletii]|nr:hypothetical protein OF83DRAFT_1178454 [Amylostereum chailletii]